MKFRMPSCSIFVIIAAAGAMFVACNEKRAAVQAKTQDCPEGWVCLKDDEIKKGSSPLARLFRKL